METNHIYMHNMFKSKNNVEGYYIMLSKLLLTDKGIKITSLLPIDDKIYDNKTLVNYIKKNFQNCEIKRDIFLNKYWIMNKLYISNELLSNIDKIPGYNTQILKEEINNDCMFKMNNTDILCKIYMSFNSDKEKINLNNLIYSHSFKKEDEKYCLLIPHICKYYLRNILQNNFTHLFYSIDEDKTFYII